MKNTNENIAYVSAELAAAAIKSGDTIWVGNTTSGYSAFLKALANRRNELHDVTILLNKGIAPCEILDELSFRNSFRVISFFKEALIKTYEEDKRAFLKSASNTIIDMICKQYGVNTMVAELCPPDSEGFCNVGAQGVYIMPMINSYSGITRRIAIIDEKLTKAAGKKAETEIPLSAFDYICSERTAVSLSA
ncbi:MAG: hypothetical protein QMB62_07465 [Oscillospiraceae bacterium]